MKRWKDLTCIIAVSGGADSVALLRIVHDLKSTHGGDGRIIAAHFNHGWRGEQSDADSKFVESLASELGIPCRVGKVADSGATLSRTPNKSEESARNQRYEFLLNTAHAEGARYLTTAHTANDQVETIMHRILRGTGLQGLGGIPVTRQLSESVSVIRPMLSIESDEVVEYLQNLKQRFRTDPTNQDCRYTRNRIRETLLPLLKDEFNPEVATALTRLGILSQQAQNEIDRIVDDFLSREVTIRQNKDAITEIVIGRPELQQLSCFLRCEVFKTIWNLQAWPMQSMGFEQWGSLASLADQQVEPTKLTLPGAIVVSVEERDITLKKA